MFEDVARELLVRQRRWVEPIVLLPSAYSTTGFLYPRSGCAFQSKLWRRSCSSSHPVGRAQVRELT